MWTGILAFVYYVFLVSIVSYPVFKHDAGPAVGLMAFSAIIYATSQVRQSLLFSLPSYMNWIAYRGLPLWIFQCISFIGTEQMTSMLFWSLGAAVVIFILEIILPLPPVVQHNLPPPPVPAVNTTKTKTPRKIK